MKKKEILYLLLLCLFIAFSGCSDSDDENDSIKKRKPSGDATLDWIYEEMAEKYLWNDQLPSDPLDTDPKPFFYSLLYKYTDKKDMSRDRFSYIEPYNESSRKTYTEEADLGFEYIPLLTKKGEIYFEVVYVKPNTTAEKQELRRGHYIYKIDDISITEENYASILEGKNSFDATYFDALGNNNTIELSRTSNYEENPIHISKVIHSDGVKIGYLMYNQFERGDNSKYDIQLMREIRNLQNQGITEFVLDLRYNPGGYVSSAIVLASALAPNRSTSNVFVKYQYNPTYHAAQVLQYGKKSVENQYFTDKVHGTSEAIPQLGLKRVYILATQYSASASELVINGLKPYMDVIHIGSTTTGKDKGSFAITPPKNKGIEWELHPLIMRVSNSEGEGNYINGLKPNVVYDEHGYLFTDNLGDPSEPLLAKAISHMTGRKSMSDSKLDTMIGEMAAKPIVGTTLSQKENPYLMFADQSGLDKIEE